MADLERPTDLILVRHGQSEANVVQKGFKEGKDIRTKEFHGRHDSEFRLSKRGIKQAKAAGAFIKSNFLDTDYWPDRFLCSPLNRTMETAIEMGISDEWEFRDELREREWAEVSLLSPQERREVYQHNEKLRQMSYYYWRPPGGESIADVVTNRTKPLLSTLYRENRGNSVIMVTHGEFIWAMRCHLERLHPIEFNIQDKDPAYKLPNCVLIHYSRRHPESGELNDRFMWRRVICPWDDKQSWNDGQWLELPLQRRAVTSSQMRKWFERAKPLKFE